MVRDWAGQRLARMSAATSARLGLGIILAFWALMLCTGYPAPFIDDISYVGVAINLALHNTFSNPFCPMHRTIGAGDFALDYVPLSRYLLAGWLKIFGVNTLSFHVLFTLLAGFVTVRIYRLFPRTGLSWLAALVITFGVYGLLGGAGLRSDAVGLSLLFIGFDAWRAKTFAEFFFKNLILSLTVITFPNVALTAMLLSLTSLAYPWLFQQQPWRATLLRTVAVAAVYAASFLFFLYLIDGRLADFLHVMKRNQELSAEGIHERFHILTPLGISKWLAVQVPFVILIVTLLVRWWGDPRRRESVFFLALTLLIFGALSISSLNSASGAHLWAFSCLMVVLFLIVSEHWDWRAWTAYAAVMAVAAFGHAHLAIQNIVAEPPLSAEQRAALRAQIDAMHPARLYLDRYSIRELYDYNFPPNAYYFETSSTAGWSGPVNMATLPANSVSVVSIENAFNTPRSPDAATHVKPLNIFGLKLYAVPINPYDLVIMDNRDTSP